MNTIHSATVLGAGTMGAQIAAHLANAGLSVLLLDLDKETAFSGLQRAKKTKPDPLFTSETARLITLGGFSTDIHKVSHSDWIIEAVSEQLDIKKQLLAQIDPLRSATAIVSSNTSGIPLTQIAEGRSSEFRKHWLGTHFFNPPRYLSLLEIIPTKDTNTSTITVIRDFADYALGKGVVVTKDTPGFIANRIGIYSALRVLEQLATGQFTVEDIDAMTGPVIGRPKSATFRTIDLTGIDILSAVAQDLSRRIDSTNNRNQFVVPSVVTDLLQRGWLGEKTTQGFYQKLRVQEGTRIETLDPETMTYRQHRTPDIPLLRTVSEISDVRERIRTLFFSKDEIGNFTRDTLGKTLLYVEGISKEIASSTADIDRAMRWGFGWELGPFEIWETLGTEKVLEACQNDTSSVSIKRLGFEPNTPLDGTRILSTAKSINGIVRKNSSASLIDIGDGVLAIEFHSKMNTIGADTIGMLQLGINEAEKNFKALVIGNEAPAFSAGANLLLVLLEAQEENWGEIDLMVRTFQKAVTNLRQSSIPVVIAPAGLTLGGGCEICLHGDRIQAAAETYMGLVETGAGLIPAGGGTKELLYRTMANKFFGATALLPPVQHVFELIGFGTISTSGPHASQLGFLSDTDDITMNKDRLLFDAKTAALAMSTKRYQSQTLRPEILVGGEGIQASLELGIHLAWRGHHISDHDALIGRKLAHILSGGNLPHARKVSEQHLLDLEREAFLSLCGEAKTQARMSHILKTGKPLRN